MQGPAKVVSGEKGREQVVVRSSILGFQCLVDWN